MVYFHDAGEVTNQWRVVGEGYIGDEEVVNVQSRAVENEVELAVGRVAGPGGEILSVGTSQPRGGEKKIQFAVPLEGVEVAGDNNLFLAFFDQLPQLLKLKLTVVELETEVDDEDAHILNIHLNYQPLAPLFEIVILYVGEWRAAEQGIGLQVHNRHMLDEGVVVVFILGNVVITEAVGYGFRLTAVVGAIGTCIHLNQRCNIRVDLLGEFDNLLNIVASMLEEPGEGKGKVVPAAVSGAVTDVIEQESHSLTF